MIEDIFLASYSVHFRPDRSQFFCRCLHCGTKFLEISLIKPVHKWFPPHRNNVVLQGTQPTLERRCHAKGCNRKSVLTWVPSESIMEELTESESFVFAQRWLDVIGAEIEMINETEFQRILKERDTRPQSLSKTELWKRLWETLAYYRATSQRTNTLTSRNATEAEIQEVLRTLDREEDGLHKANAARIRRIIDRLQYVPPEYPDADDVYRLYDAEGIVGEMLTEFWNLPKKQTKKA